MVVMGVLVSLGVPRFQRTLEQARADVSGASLRAIWTAQRLHWLNDPARTYAPSLQALCDEGLLDKSLAASNAIYVYMDPEADPDDPPGFIVRARRAPGSSWFGDLKINARGEITSTVTGPGGPVSPAGQ
jgi:hypothetical protein